MFLNHLFISPYILSLCPSHHLRPSFPSSFSLSLSLSLPLSRPPSLSLSLNKPFPLDELISDRFLRSYWLSSVGWRRSVDPNLRSGIINDQWINDTWSQSSDSFSPTVVMNWCTVFRICVCFLNHVHFVNLTRVSFTIHWKRRYE